MKKYAAVTSGVSIPKLQELHDTRHQQVFPVVDEKTRIYLGYITYDDVTEYMKKYPECQNSPAVTSGNILIEVIPADATRPFIRAHLDESPEQALSKIRRYDLDFIPVVDHDEVYKGIIDKESLLRLINQR
ncbi:MAG: CBS domain-containing protein [Chloroflexi bacterium]|nr:CBS domain-containing protein [Chloroflexota bacterium]